MRYLILSDIHGNREALAAVLADAAGLYDRIACCGDLVGYGPDPNAVVDWARSGLHAVIRGNHDRACSGLEDLNWFNPAARTSCLWTARQLTGENSSYLRNLAAGPLNLDGFQLVHGSPLDEDEYVLSFSDARGLFPFLESTVVFFGHTHVQCVWARINGRYQALNRHRPGDAELRFRAETCGSYLVNPGSVGQPRDGDSRAAYAVYDTESRDVLLRRCPYDSSETRRKILAANLPEALAARLGAGR